MDFEIVRKKLVSYRGNEEIVTVPEGVTSIGEECFRDKSFIKEIRILEKEVKIGVRAFFGCTLDKIVGERLYFNTDSLVGCAVAHIYDPQIYLQDDCGLENCTVHSWGATPGLTSSYFVWEFCQRHAQKGVCWAYLNTEAEKREIYQKAQREFEEKEAALEAFRASAKLGLRGFFCKNSPKTLALREQDARLEAEYKEAKKVWWAAYNAFKVEEGLVQKAEQLYREYLEKGRGEYGGSVSVEAVMQRMQNGGKKAEPDGAFVPVPDVTGI